MNWLAMRNNLFPTCEVPYIQVIFLLKGVEITVYMTTTLLLCAQHFQ